MLNQVVVIVAGVRYKGEGPDDEIAQRISKKKLELPLHCPLPFLHCCRNDFLADYMLSN